VWNIFLFPTRLVHRYDASCIGIMTMIKSHNHPRETMMGNLRKAMYLAKLQHYGWVSTEMMKMSTRVRNECQEFML
jgi:hypothetical protein